MEVDFKIFLMILAAVGFGISYGAEKFVFPALARWIGRIKVKINPKSKKKRKEYKIIAERMAIG